MISVSLVFLTCGCYAGAFLDCAEQELGRMDVDEVRMCVCGCMRVCVYELCFVCSSVETHLGHPNLAALATSSKMGLMLSVLGH